MQLSKAILATSAFAITALAIVQAGKLEQSADAGTALIGQGGVIAITSSMPAPTASRMASAAKAGGTKIIVALAPVASRASATVSNTGSPATVSPPLPGVTPPTIRVP